MCRRGNNSSFASRSINSFRRLSSPLEECFNGAVGNFIRDLLDSPSKAIDKITDLLSSFNSPAKGDRRVKYYQPEFEGEITGGKFDLFDWNLGGSSSKDAVSGWKKPGGSLSIGPEIEGHLLQGKVTMKTPGRFNRFMPVSFSNIPFINSDVNTELTATGPSGNASLGLHNKSLQAGIGASLVSAKAEQSRKLSVAGKVKVSAEVGLKAELGFSIGKKTELKLPLISIGFGLG